MGEDGCKFRRDPSGVVLFDGGENDDNRLNMTILFGLSAACN